MSKIITDQFHQEMLHIYDAALKLNPPYRAKSFLKMINEHGGKATADKLLATTNPSEGFTELYLRGKDSLRLSVEYLVLTDPWKTLFNENQLAIATKRLKEVECPLPSQN